MSFNRYARRPHIQPSRQILPAITDVQHTMTQFSEIDNLAKKYYGDATLGWIIMCGNPEWSFEFEIPVGTVITIPYPLSRVLDAWGVSNDI